MLHQPENEALTPQELRQALLSEIEASQQAIRELSDEQLEQITGGEVVPYGIPQVIASGSRTHAIAHAAKHTALQTVFGSVVNTVGQLL